MPFGLQLLSTTPITLMPRRWASETAIASLPTSITKIAAGSLFISLMPARDLAYLSQARLIRASSFFESASRFSSSAWISSIVLYWSMDFLTVFQLVIMPPSQRELTYDCLQRIALAMMWGAACRLVPTNKTPSPSEVTSVKWARAFLNSGRVWSRSRMWVPLRAPKMKRFICGFQRWVW